MRRWPLKHPDSSFLRFLLVFIDFHYYLVFRCDWAKYFADVLFGMAQKYQCTICGYIYDPEKGDPDSAVAPGTPFADLPQTWTCPQCGASKDDFKEMK